MSLLAIVDMSAYATISHWSWLRKFLEKIWAGGGFGVTNENYPFFRYIS